jgi:hypothetical protein
LLDDVDVVVVLDGNGDLDGDESKRSSLTLFHSDKG